MNAVSGIEQSLPRFRPGDWVRHAACAGVDPELFFPGKGESSKQAKAICARCSVAEECNEYAAANREPWGIWGGKSIRDRRADRRAERRAR